jgi:sec-independent protein translocase protein TatC
MAAEDIDDTRMPLLDHLVELRRRLIYSFLALIVLFFVSYFFSEDIFRFLVQPYADLVEGQANRRMIFTALHEAFFTYIKVAAFSALFFGFPIFASQLWLFVAPGLYRNEKGAFLPFLIATPILFIMGGAMVYYIVMPLAFKFFLSFESVGGDGALPIQLEAKVDQYLSLAMRLIFAFGVSFELPVLMTLLARVGMVSAAGLADKREYAMVLAFVAAAILTPPDVISQIMLAVPIIILYEISILSAKFVERQRAAREKAEEEAQT